MVMDQEMEQLVEVAEQMLELDLLEGIVLIFANCLLMDHKSFSENFLYLENSVDSVWELKPAYDFV